MSAAADLVQEAFRTEEHGIDWRSGLAGALASVGPLAVGLLVGEPAAGLWAAIGGLNVALSVPRASRRARVWWGSLAVLGEGGALVAADAAGGSDAGLVLMTLAWIGAWAFLRALGPSGAVLGFTISAAFVVLAGLPATAPLGQRLLWLAFGAVAGLALMVLVPKGVESSVRFGSAALRPLGAAVRQDTALRSHALRLAGAVAAGTLLYRVMDLPHGFWVPLTTLAILQPSERGTRVRGLQRAAGTLLASALIVAITALTDLSGPLVACAWITAAMLYALDEHGYFWLVVLLTPTVLLMISAVDFEGDTVALDRVANSMLGIVIGLIFGELVRARAQSTASRG